MPEYIDREEALRHRILLYDLDGMIGYFAVETDCRNQTHGAYDDWEALRKIQEKGESDNAES